MFISTLQKSRFKQSSAVHFDLANLNKLNKNGQISLFTNGNSNKNKDIYFNTNKRLSLFCPMVFEKSVVQFFSRMTQKTLFFLHYADVTHSNGL